MSYHVRPLSFAEILDESFKVLKDHFTVLFSICAVLYVPFNVLSALVAPKMEAGVPSVTNLAGLGVSAILLLLLMLVSPLMQLAVTQAVAAAYLSTPMSVGSAIRSASKLVGKYLATLLLVGLGVIGSMILLIVPGIYFAVCWMLVGPILVVEGLSGRAAMRRSRALIKGYFWRALGTVFVVSILGTFVGMAVQAVVGAIPILGAALVGVVQSVTAAFTEIALVVLYVDLRCRKEDFDLTRLASSISTDTSAVPPTIATSMGS